MWYFQVKYCLFQVLHTFRFNFKPLNRISFYHFKFGSYLMNKKENHRQNTNTHFWYSFMLVDAHKINRRRFIEKKKKAEAEYTNKKIFSIPIKKQSAVSAINLTIIFTFGLRISRSVPSVYPKPSFSHFNSFLFFFSWSTEREKKNSYFKRWVPMAY